MACLWFQQGAQDCFPGFFDTFAKPVKDRRTISFMKNFAAIDFETANNDPASVCSVGIVVVREGEIAERFYRLIRPNPNWYSEFNTRIHGLTYQDTVEADKFPAVWEEAHELVRGLPMAAHFAPFDETCLKYAFRKYGMPYPEEYLFHCTCAASRRVFGRTLPNHKLPTVAAQCGFDLTAHHHALADAEACAMIAMHIL